MIFLIYLHSQQVGNHSMKQLVLLYQVYYHSNFFSSIDIPFTNGMYIHGIYTGFDCSYCKPAFYSLPHSGITSDSGRFLLFHFIHSLIKSKTTNSISFKEIISLVIPSFLHLSPLFPNSHESIPVLQILRINNQ